MPARTNCSVGHAAGQARHDAKTPPLIHECVPSRGCGSYPALNFSPSHLAVTRLQTMATSAGQLLGLSGRLLRKQCCAPAACISERTRGDEHGENHQQLRQYINSRTVFVRTTLIDGGTGGYGCLNARTVPQKTNSVEFCTQHTNLFKHMRTSTAGRGCRYILTRLTGHAWLVSKISVTVLHARRHPKVSLPQCLWR